MLPLEEVDHSMYLQCPMPGQLISLSVKEGDSVEVGQVLHIHVYI
jgi:biotin carboxyl carrier protein